MLAGADKAFASKFSLLGDLGYVEASIDLQRTTKDLNINIESIGYKENKISFCQELSEPSREWIQQRLNFLEM